jgi:hypothetical protein
MVGLFLVAAAVTVAAVPPALALGDGRRRPRAVDERMLPDDGEQSSDGATREPDLVL